MQRRRFWSRIGPAFVVGAVVIGPGSVTVMSQTGASYGYQMIWLSLLAGALMAGFIALFMRFGLYSEETFLDVTAKKFGRWYAVLCGLSLFLAGASFQTGNNLGVAAAMKALTPGVEPVIWPILFTLAAIIFLFSFKSIYRVIEKMMTVFLVGMFLAFLVNLIWAKPDLLTAAQGAVIPSLPAKVEWIKLGGLVGTTFVLPAAVFQSYLVKAKGWNRKDLADGALDTILASIVYTLIGTVIMMTAAAILHGEAGTGGKVTFDSMVTQLEGVFGRYAKLMFAAGYWSAAFSSFITNALIAGLLLNDGVGLGGRIESRSTKLLAAAAMLVGTAVAVIVLRVAPGIDVTAIAIGQALTMLAVPFAGVAMVVILFDAKLTDGKALPWPAKLFVLFGAAVLVGIGIVLYTRISDEFQRLVG